MKETSEDLGTALVVAPRAPVLGKEAEGSWLTFRSLFSLVERWQSCLWTPCCLK